MEKLQCFIKFVFCAVFCVVLSVCSEMYILENEAVATIYSKANISKVSVVAYTCSKHTKDEKKPCRYWRRIESDHYERKRIIIYREYAPRKWRYTKRAPVR